MDNDELIDIEESQFVTPPLYLCVYGGGSGVAPLRIIMGGAIGGKDYTCGSRRVCLLRL